MRSILSNSCINQILLAAMGFILLLPFHSSRADDANVGLPACEQVVGVDRYIEIGNTVSYTIEYLEKNNYRCEEFKGRRNEIISCRYQLDYKSEVLLTVENGTVVDIDTLHDGMECSYFNIKPADPRALDPDWKKQQEEKEKQIGEDAP